MGALAIIGTFGLPAIIVFLTIRHKERMKRLELEVGQQKALPPAKDGQTVAELKERVAHLETIVCSVDFELNAKLNRLAGQQSQMFAMTGPKDSELAFDQTTALTGPAGRLTAGQRVADRFVVDRPLGAGGMGAELCAGLAAAHEQGIVHRDLKPGNVLFDDQGRAKIIDFGLARLPHIEGMTATGMILGTPEYMAPEQIKGATVDPRTDLYSLGALIFHALAGRPPYQGETPISVGLKQITEPLPSMDELPAGWAEIVTRAMSKDPSHRFESAQQMRDALPS